MGSIIPLLITIFPNDRVLGSHSTRKKHPCYAKRQFLHKILVVFAPEKPGQRGYYVEHGLITVSACQSRRYTLQPNKLRPRNRERLTYSCVADENYRFSSNKNIANAMSLICCSQKYKGKCK